ncbi:hypothetical protein BDA96_04G319600 [Sorghum bicolor]|uniref:Uncharacterized protein n=1 Tax=Sorghum bicolor TaxID=4558 RepID=A0A921R6K6_SORBI|nr:hypothetical protein BDA96_04G319600 [Sorghum bicolor]
MDRARSGAAAAATDDEEIEKHEPVPEDMESDPAAAREKEQVPPWREQVTLRGMVAALLIGFMYTVIVMKMVLSTGQLPTLNVSAALMAFLALRGWTRVLERLGVAHRPFTRQENCVVETCAVACYTIAFGGGFGSTLLGLDKKTYELAGASPANVPGSYKDPGFGWMAGFVAAISFAGLLSLIPLRKTFTGFGHRLQVNLPKWNCNCCSHKRFPHQARRQECKYFGLSFIWSFFQWFYTGGDVCGFVQFPTFGLKAWKQTFFFDFSLTYVGAGMICSHLVNISTLLGAILSWGILWPLISKQKGEWYPANIPESSMKSLYGYKAFLCIALIIGDGMYHFFKVFGVTVKGLHQRLNQKHASNRVANGGDEMVPLDDRQRDEIFNNGSFPAWAAYAGYALLTVISVITIPHIFRQVKWYYIIVAYVLAPLLGFANSYGTGLTDINMAYNYGKIALFIFAAWASKENGVIAGLAGGTLVKQLVIASADLMHDFKTGHLTLTSPRSLLVAQFIGTAMGCVVAPLTFLLFYNAFDIGNPNGYWKAPYGLIYRNMAILGVEGFSVLPKHCLALSAGFFVFAFVFSVARDVLPRKYARKEAMFMVPAVASGLICGDGIWTFPSSVLALAKIKPPICMKFTPGS